MKKISALFVSAVMTVCGITAASSSAAGSTEGYCPRLYMVPTEQEGSHIIGSNKVYVNLNETADGKINAGANVYIDDERNNAGLVFVKWKSPSEDIELTDLIDPFTIAGAAPYSDFTKASLINLSNENGRYHCVGYALSMPDPYTWTGKKSDDYPLAGFKAEISRSIAPGEYVIDFMNEGSNRCDILYRFEDGSIDEAFPSGNYVKGMKIAVSDRKLGDVDGSGKLEASDASLVLYTYAHLNATGKSELTPAQFAAADVDGDGRVTASDASSILGYYAYLSHGNGESIYDYMASRR